MATSRAFLLLPKARIPQCLSFTQQVRHKATPNGSNSTSSLPAIQRLPQQTKLPSIADDENKELVDLRLDTGYMYPNQMDWIDERQVRISRPSKNVMQSGTASTSCWKIEFDSQTRWENWLIGWTSTADPLSNLTLTFPSKETAIAYCEKNKLQWFLEDQPERKVRRKSYADNFAYNRRTRLGNK